MKLGWAHGALITTFPGDTTMATLDQVRAFAKGGSARIQRIGFGARGSSASSSILGSVRTMGSAKTRPAGRRRQAQSASARRRGAARNRVAVKRRTPSVIPMISYEDGVGALEWLARAFGFRETTRLTASDGSLLHGEMRAGDGLIMLASPTPDYRGPKRHREACEQARRWSAVPWIIDGVLVFVERLKATSRAPGPPVRRSSPKSKRGRPADGIEPKIWKAIAGSFSNADDGRRNEAAESRMAPTVPSMKRSSSSNRWAARRCTSHGSEARMNDHRIPF